MKNGEARAKQTVLVFGGHGGLSNHYRSVAEKQGYSLQHFEKRVPGGARHGAGSVALVVVMVGMVSHALLDQAREIAAGGVPVVYLRTPSVSALRAAVEQRASGAGSEAWAA